MGFNAASAFMLIDREIHKNNLLVFWILVRSLYNALPSVGPFGPVIFMCLSTSQLLSSWIKAPHDLNSYEAPSISSQPLRSYLAFLDWQSGIMKVDRVWASKPGRNIPRPCFLVHPNQVSIPKITLLIYSQNCEEHAVYFFVDSLFRALRLYFPLHFMLTAMSKDKSVPYFLENLIRSSVFLAGYCSAACVSQFLSFQIIIILGYSACTVHRVLPRVSVSRLSLMLHVWVAGLFILLERPRRQVELAMYCSTYALDSVYRFIRTTELGKSMHNG